jgi:RND family efflux transporter MFP subunit
MAQPHTGSRRWQVPVALILCLAALQACGKSSAAPPGLGDAAVLVVPENLAVVDSELVENGPTLSGMLDAQRAAQIRAQVGGAVLALYVEKGARVPAGAPLALIDTLVPAEQVRSARSQLRSAQAGADVAKKNWERADALHRAGAIADRDLEAARSQQLAADANVADAGSRLASAENQLANALVRAPFGGVVSERPVNTGDVVQPGSALLTLVDPGTLILEASVAAENLAAIKPGTKVEFAVTGVAGHRFTGRIARINPAVDPVTRQVQLYVEVPNPGQELASGLFAEGRVAVSSVRMLAIPVAALDLRAAAPSVKRVRGGKVESVAVTLGVRDDLSERVAVVGGLVLGDTLLVGGLLDTPTGSMVRVTRADH